MMKKHAYLVMAHHQLDLLNKLLLCLDHPDNDIIVHIDKKSPIQEKQIGRGLKYSKVYFTERTNVTWGGYSQVNADLVLLKKALECGEHHFYHLLTGQDLPIKPIEEVNRFYEGHIGNNFIHFSNKKFAEDRYEQRFCYKQLFIAKCGRKHNFYWYLNKVGIIIQKIIKYKHKEISKNEFYMGSAFWSITHEFADFLVNSEEYIRTNFKYALCGDESLAQIMIMKSDYKNTLFDKEQNDDKHGNMRYTDFSGSKDGSPKVIYASDVEKILETDYMFARKFDINLAPTAVDKVLSVVM